MRLGLQVKLSLAFLLLAGLLVGGTSAVLYRRIQSQFAEDFDDRVAVARDAVRQQLARDAELLRASVEGLSRDPRLTTLLQDLANDRFGVEQARQLLEDAEALRRAAGLDALWLLDGAKAGRVLAAPHRASEARPGGSIGAFVRRGLRGHVVVSEVVVRGGRPVVVPVLAIGARRDRLVLVGGRVVGEAVTAALRLGAGAGAEVSVRDREGRVVASTLTDPDPPRHPSGYETALVALRNPDEPAAALEVSIHVSRTQLDAQVAVLVQATAVAAGGATFLALLFGIAIARRITRPIQALVDATRRVGAGERDVVLALGRRDEIGELVEAFERMTQELTEGEIRLKRAERVAAWKDIARELAHEIKNPLTPIQMAIETLRRTWARRHPKFEEVFEESTGTILEEVARLKTIVSEFSEFARMPPPKLQDCDLNDLVHQSVALYREAAEGVAVAEELDPELPALRLDPERMTQVVQNLLQNAIQATSGRDRPGRVLVGTRYLGGRAEGEVVVADNGPGIADDDLERVFTPYYTKKVGGTGLGLAVVHRVVTDHGGRIGVSSRMDEGTRFVVRLPLVPR